MDRDVNSITEESEEIEITDRQDVDNVELSVWPVRQQAGTVQLRTYGYIMSDVLYSGYTGECLDCETVSWLIVT